jgi:hypothetical protein
MNGGRTFSEMLAEIEALRAENERLRKLLKGCWQTDTLPRAVEMEIEDALKGGDG